MIGGAHSRGLLGDVGRGGGPGGRVAGLGKYSKVAERGVLRGGLADIAKLILDGAAVCGCVFFFLVSGGKGQTGGERRRARTKTAASELLDLPIVGSGGAVAADAVAHVEGGEAVEVPPADADERLDAVLGEGRDEVGEGRESWKRWMEK